MPNERKKGMTFCVNALWSRRKREREREMRTGAERERESVCVCVFDEKCAM